MSDSVQTRIARTVHTALAGELAAHLMDCAQCKQAKSRRRPGERCAEGQELAVVTREASALVKREIAADLAPNPDQQALFD